MAATRRTATLATLASDFLLQQVALVLSDFHCPMHQDDLVDCTGLSLAKVRLGLAQARRRGFIESPHRGYSQAPTLRVA